MNYEREEIGVRTPRALNRTLAKQNPEGAFGSPFEIVGEKLFTKGEKIATLNRWRQSLLEELERVRRGHAHARSHGRACAVAASKSRRPAVS